MTAKARENRKKALYELGIVSEEEITAKSARDALVGRG